MEIYHSEEEYLKDCMVRSRLPKGFLASTTTLDFYPLEKKVEQPVSMNLSLILLEKSSPYFAAVFTSNAFPGAPVKIGKKRILNETLRGVLINNKIANVCVADGERDAELILSTLGSLLGDNGNSIMPSSTGVIGWRLPVDEIKNALPDLIKGLQGETVFPVAKAIMTTDSFPKVRSFLFGKGSTVGIAKGAGMIEPNMATMLSFILTDIKLEREEMRRMLKRAVERSFNRISIDGDQSTSDMVVFISSGRERLEMSEENIRHYENKLTEMCRKLAEDIVRNGEGVGHVIGVSVKNAKSEKLAVEIGKAVVNSPLVKTAIFGNDPNVGRIVSSIGDYIGNNFPCNNAISSISVDRIVIRVGGEIVFERGTFKLNEEKEKKLLEYFKSCALETEGKRFPRHERKVEIEIDMNDGKCEGFAIGSDLSYQYVRENADYRS